MEENVFEVILIIIGVITGWILSSTRSHGRKSSAVKAHRGAVRALDKRKRAKIALIEAQKIESDRQADKKKSKGKKMSTSRLARAIREAFRRGSD